MTGGAGVTFGGMHRALFMPHQHMNELIVLEKCVIDRQYRAARIAEDVLDAVVLEGADDDLRSAQFDVVCSLHCDLLIHGALPGRLNKRADSKRKGRCRPL